MNLAEVLLPLPLASTFTYSVPDELLPAVRPGCRVVVPFGRRRYHTGIVILTRRAEAPDYEVKPVAMSLDGGDPIVRYPQLKLWEWLADYYLCTMGEVYRAAMPGGLMLESETFLELNDNYCEDPANTLSEKEALVVQVLDHQDKRMSIEEIERATGLRSIASLAAGLLLKGAVIVSERLMERYRVRRETYVRPAAEPGDMQALRTFFAATERAPKQQKALQTLLELTGFTKSPEHRREVSRAELVERTALPASIIAALAAKGVVETYTRELDRFKYSGSTGIPLPALTPAQQEALRAIHASWREKPVTLLHGVTSSGKTEIYMHLIERVLEMGLQVLLLVPEIALTTQLAHRLQKVFGDKVVVSHSKFSDNRRCDLWRHMLTDSSPRVILGARSSVFLPFAKLGLVIVDEEHEQSYKQQSPAPRYNARDAAIVLASMHGAKVLLGSATPAVDTYWKATEGKRFNLVELTERYGGATLPAMEVIDLAAAARRGATPGAMAPRTRQLVAESLSRGRQAIMFLNRRGFAPVARCRMCGHTPRCHSCDVTLTYHRSRGLLVCHYCGATQALPTVCPACHEPAMEVVGYGSERIEEEVAAAFPTARIARMDLDTTRNKDGYENLIDDFSARRSDILVGTQMVTKGLDFGGVDTVCVVSADSMLRFPDFRSSERAFAMIEQVAGRAGRRGDNPGTVTVQTFSPDNPVIGFLKAHDYAGFYAYEIEERRTYAYPPFTRLILAYVKHRDAETCAELAALLGHEMRTLFGNRVHGPEEPPVNRIRNLYIRRIMLKIEPAASMPKVRAILTDLRNRLHAADRRWNQAQLFYDVDPN